MSGWITRNIEEQLDLLKRHAEILETLCESDKPLGIIRLSKMTGHSPHLVRYSLKELKNADAVRASTRGALLTSKTKTFLNNLNKEIDGIQDELGEFSEQLSEISIKKR